MIKKSDLAYSANNMKKLFLNLKFFCMISVCCAGLALALPHAAKADDTLLTYEEDIFPKIRGQLLEGNFQEVVIILKHVLTDDDLNHYEKVYLLEKCSLLSQNMGYFKEAGEILELAYLINNLEKELRIQIHKDLTAYYEKIRNWDKCIKAHFYFLESVKVDNEEKTAVLFEIVKNYQNLMQYKKAERVLGEIIGLCDDDRDFACVYYYQALGCVGQNKYGKAVNLFKKALKYNELTEEETGIALYRTGFCHEILQDAEKAAEYYKKALPLYQNPALIQARLDKLAAKKN